MVQPKDTNKVPFLETNPIKPILTFIKRVDLFSEQFSFKIEDDHDRKQTFVGAIVSILILTSAFLFAYLKYVIMVDHGDTRIIFKEMDHFYSYEDVVNIDMGFQVAFGLTEFDDSLEFIDDADYATLEVQLRSWGFENEEIGETINYTP